jgi:hypothetical protein
MTRCNTHRIGGEMRGASAPLRMGGAWANVRERDETAGICADQLPKQSCQSCITTAACGATSAGSTRAFS